MVRGWDDRSGSDVQDPVSNAGCSHLGLNAALYYSICLGCGVIFVVRSSKWFSKMHSDMGLDWLSAMNGISLQMK